jgi:hypothetical protein
MRISLLSTALATLALSSVAFAQRADLPQVEHFTPIRPTVDNRCTAAVHTPEITGAEQIRTQPGSKLPIDRKRSQSVLSLGPGDSVGYTYYDFQTNGAMPDRIVVWPGEGNNGILKSMVWMAATDQTAGTTTRGTFGAVNDGTQWYPINFGEWGRLETVRTGFCDVDHLSTGELVIANHSSVGSSPTDGNPNVLVEKSPGSGDFQLTQLPNSDGGLWPRMAVGGNDVIHVIYTFQTGGTPTPANAGIIKYVRSTDKGATWSEAIDLTGTASAVGNLPLTQGGDAYALAANGDHVVLWYYTTGTQIIQVRSSDGGQTWDSPIVAFRPEYTRVFVNHSNPDSTFYTNNIYGGDTLGYRSDTVITPGSSMDVLVDADGRVHGVFPIFDTYLNLTVSASASEDTTKIRSITLTETRRPDFGLMYFTELNQQGLRSLIRQPGNMTGTEEFLDDRGLNGGLSRWPQLGFDSQNRLYCAFGAGVASDVINAKSQLEDNARDYLYSHIFAAYTIDGSTWGEPLNLTPNGVDCQWPSLANRVTNELTIAYGADTYPGDWLTSSGVATDGVTPTGSGLHQQLRNNVEVMSIASSTLPAPIPAGVTTDKAADRTSGATLTSVSPNPTTGVGQISYSIARVGEYTITLVNPLGQKVQDLLMTTTRQPGQYTIGFDGSGLPQGRYMIVMSGNGTTSTMPLTLMH